MVGAHLWKRILNEGINLSMYAEFAGGKIPTSDETMVRHVITSPIIVDRSQDFRADFYLEEFYGDRIGLPFPRLWVEFKKTQSTLNGIMIGGTGKPTPNGSFSYAVVAFQAIDGKRPIALPPCALHCSKDHVLKSVVDGYLVMREQMGHPIPSHESPANHCLGMLLGALRLLSCANVRLQPHDNEPKQVRRAIKRHGGNADSYRYHTLVVRPPGAHKDSPAQEIGIMPRHVCRGHFAEYGPEFNKGLLFGRYSGRFYIPPHLKGDKKNGVVEKDYAIPAM
jgi:hypothetical protein